ncbi:hypothetical protein VLK31_28270 [Variovorax sp. H27-G14]|uniref:hypothetical protein n=1 Tax=Variovorax sp. H27-G14 TaxID=3111914 RepID=UPI0038FC825D
MPLKFLRDIALRSFPVYVTDREVMKRVAVLKATGLIEADISPPLLMSDRFSPHEVAVISHITIAGHVELARESSEIA